MSNQKVLSHLFTAAIIFLAVDILLGIIYFLWLYIKQYEKKQQDKKDLELKQRLHISSNPLTRLPVREVEYSPDLFEIPGSTISIHGNDRNLRQKPLPSSNRRKSKGGEIDAHKYSSHKKKIKLSNIPRLYFELFYDFRTSQIQVSLKHGKHLPEYANEQIIVGIIMSHCCTIYHTSRVDGPHPTFNEEVRFPLDSMQISCDPPVMLKFNVWTIDNFSRKNPFGSIEVSIEEIFTQQGQGVNPTPGEATVYRNIMASDTLTDDSQQGDVLISLSYLHAAQRISIILVKAKNLIISTTDKEIQGKITLLYRDVEQKVYFSGAVEMSSNPEFNEEFVFNLSDYRNVNIEGIAINFELQSRQLWKFMSPIHGPRLVGKFSIGNSGSSDRFGKEHWATVLTANSSVSKWHCLKPCQLS